jgi:outer membrane protein assembly factor BamE (lipoprotein component of BamABCDE complex)
MMRKTPLTLISILLLAALLGGCSVADMATAAASIQGMVQTSVAQTVQVVSTQLVQ